jgi:hypothetical protein
LDPQRRPSPTNFPGARQELVGDFVEVVHLAETTAECHRAMLAAGMFKEFSPGWPRRSLTSASTRAAPEHPVG